MILGVDPGAHGALALLHGGHLVAVHDMPNHEIKVGKTKRTRVAVAELAELLRGKPIDAAFIECVSAMRGQGVSSCFSFGYAAGVVEGVLAALCIPVSFITPQAWKRGMRVQADKDTSRQRACQLFPAHSAAFSRVKDDGRAEAALIAMHGFLNGATL